MTFNSRGFLLDSGGRLNALEKGYYNARVENTPEAMRRWVDTYRKADPDGIFAPQHIYSSECLFQTGKADCGQGTDLWMMAAQMGGAVAMGTGLGLLEKGMGGGFGIKTRRSLDKVEIPKKIEPQKISLEAQESWGNLKSLEKHFEDHRANFGAKNMNDYARKAAEFFQQSQKKGHLTKIDSKGIIRIYDPKTNTLGVYNSDGTTKSFYKPQNRSEEYHRGHTEQSHLEYWNKQKGKLY